MILEWEAYWKTGEVWVGARGSGLYRRLPDGSVQRYTTRQGLPSENVNTLLEDREGRLWIGTTLGLCLLVPEPDPNRPAVARVYGEKDFGVNSNWVEALFQSSDGRIWAGTSAGLSEFTPGAGGDEPKFRSYARAHGLNYLDLMSLAEDSAGNLWIGATGGAMKLARNGFITYTEVDGRTPLGVLSIFETRSGELCFIVETPVPEAEVFLIRYVEKGLSVIQPNFPKHITHSSWGWSQHGLQDRAGERWITTVWCVTSDQWGRIYAFTGRGLDRLDPASGRIKRYTTTDGLVGDLPTAAFRDRQGALWFATFAGLSKLIPEPDSPELPPPILISGLRIAGEWHPLSELGETEVPAIRLGPNDDQIQIDFVGLSFGTGEQLRYQYKLEGADAGWGAPSDQRSVNYAQLSPGSYRFMVRAVTSNGTTSQSPASFSFTILPPIWQRWWFVTLAALALSALAYAAYRYRLARLIELERVRTRIATDLHDDIGASLSRIAILSEVCKRQVDGAGREAVPLLSEIADSARTLVDSMRDIVWAINPRHDDLLGVVSRVRQFASGLLEPRNIRCDLRTAPGIEKIKLDPDERRHLFLFFKEAVTNAARHAECRSLSISLTAERHRLVAEVRDDGRGFEAPVPDTAKVAGGHGLRNMEGRAAQLRAQLTIESGLGQGTLLRLAIPLRRR